MQAGEIPFELWEEPERRQVENRAVSEAPSTVGVNLDTLQPAVFAPSVASFLGLEMPEVESGSYATGTITTPATAAAKAESGAADETAAAFSVESSVPHRVPAALKLRIEDIAAVGSSNFESLLKDHISMAVSDELNDLIINGTGSSNEPHGFLSRLTDAANPATGIETWSRFLKVQSAGIDGLWAAELQDVALLVGLTATGWRLRFFREAIPNEALRTTCDRSVAGSRPIAKCPVQAPIFKRRFCVGRGEIR